MVGELDSYPRPPLHSELLVAMINMEISWLKNLWLLLFQPEKVHFELTHRNSVSLNSGLHR
jgi:hypothetical protein